MPYTPSNPVDLVFGQSAPNIVGGPVTLDFSPNLVYITGAVQAPGVSASGLLYQPIAQITGSATVGGAAVAGTLVGRALLDGDITISPPHPAGTLTPYRMLAGSARSPFGAGAAMDRRPRAPFGDGSAASPQISAPWGAADPTQAAASLGWGTRPARDVTPAVQWADHQSTTDRMPRCEWGATIATDRDVRAVFGGFADGATDRNTGHPYRYPAWRDESATIPFAAFGTFDRMTDGRWDTLHRRDDTWPRLPWGAGEPPRRPPFPPQPPAPQPDDPIYVPSGDLCFHERHTGSTTLNFRRQGRCSDLGTIAMIHTLTLTRLPERTPVEMLACSLTIADGDLAWGAKIIIPDRDNLDLIAPEVDNLNEVELTIDGHVWWLLVEGYEEDRRFGESAYSVSCRSPTAWLAAPYAPAAEQDATQAWAASQLADNAVAGTGWSINWDLRRPGDVDAFDWLVPAGAWRHNPLTPAEAVAAVAVAAGGVVEPARAARQLRVRFKHRAPRWAWPDASPDVVLPPSRIYRVAAQYQPGAEHDKVYVFGEQSGAAAGVTRTGYAGNKPAPTVIDSLCTTIPACTERGRQVLSDSGGRLRMTVEAPFGEGVSPLWPGYLAEIAEAEPWRGIVTGLSINAQIDNDVIVAGQVAQIERTA